MKRFFSRLFGSDKALVRKPLSTRRFDALETLEDRCVPATLQLLGGVLTYDAGAAVGNNLNVSLSGATYTFRDTAETINVLGILGATGSGTNTVTVPAARVGPAGMRLNLGDKADLLTVESTVNAIVVKAGADNDTIDIGKLVGGTVGAIQAAVTVDGEGGSDALRINDAASGTSRNYAISATQVTPSGSAAIVYAGVERLTVTAGSLADSFAVRGTAAGTTTTLDAGAGIDTFNVGSAANTLDDIKGPVRLVGGANAPFPLFLPDAVNLFDQGSVTGRSYTVRDNSVARSGSEVIVFSEVERVTLNAGAGADAVTVLATAAGTPVTLNLGAGNDVVNIGTRTGTSMDLIAATVTVNGEAGSDTIVLNDQTETNANFYLVTATEVRRNIVPVLNYANAESLTLNAGAFNDSATVQSTSAATPVALNMGGGDDTVFVQNGIQSLDEILGIVTVDGQAGVDQLTLNDQGDNSFNDYIVTGTNVVRSFAASVTYAGLEGLTVNAASNRNIILGPGNFSLNNRLFVKSTSVATKITSGTFNGDLYLVGNNSNSLDDIRGALTIDAGGTLVLNDQGDADANSYTITSTTVTRTGAAPITYKVDFNSGLTLNAGAANDSVAVKSTSAETLLNLGAGNDSVTLGSGGFLASSLGGIGAVTVRGQGGADAVLVNESDAGIVPVLGQNYRITAAGVTSRNFAFRLSYDTVESLELRAGSGNDTFTFLSTAAATPVIVRGGFGNDTFKMGSTTEFVTNPNTLLGAVTLDGQGNTDTLDYSAYTVAVRVNLAAGRATGAAGGVSNIENVTGGSANDILVGDDQANVLKGGPGRDILIGRGGPDTLLGEGGDDILIGGSTVHDLNVVALEDLMREWGRTDLFGTQSSQYATRIIHLIGIGGLNGATTLDLSKVTDDGVADSVDGGADFDWYFKLGGDTIVGLGSLERVN